MSTWDALTLWKSPNKRGDRTLKQAQIFVRAIVVMLLTYYVYSRELPRKKRIIAENRVGLEILEFRMIILHIPT